MVFLKEHPQRLIPRRARDRGVIDLEGRKLLAAFDLEVGVRLHQGALGWVGVVIFQHRSGLPRAEDSPRS